MKKREKKHRDQPQSNAVEQMINEAPSSTDPLGSWTGKPSDEYESPVQDADDL